MQGHDGTTRRYNGSALFYYHAIGYPALNETGGIDGCSGAIYARNNSILVYSSPTLSSGSWKLEDQVYPGGDAGFPECTYFRSQAVYNPATGKYVLWANAVGCKEDTCPGKRCASYAIGTAPAPGGPFKFAGMAEVLASALPPTAGNQGDFALFVDTAGDGSGYVLLTHLIAGAGHRDMFVFRLTPDFLGVDANASSGILPGPHLVEAPAMFERAGTYYAFLGGCTCMGLYVQIRLVAIDRVRGGVTMVEHSGVPRGKHMNPDECMGLVRPCAGTAAAWRCSPRRIRWARGRT
jgi:hypothetical protein